MVANPKKLRSKVGTFDSGYDMIEYPEGVTVMVAYEFNVYNLGDINVEMQFNEIGDVLVLEPGEGFETNMPIAHAIIKTDGATVKYSYWC